MVPMRSSLTAIPVAILLLQASVSSQDRGRPESVTISINEGRPLAAAALKLQDKYGVPISYEDVKWVNTSELTPLGRIPGNQSATLRYPDRPSPAIGLVEIRLEQDGKTHDPVTPLGSLLTDLVNEHVGRRNPGEFSVVNLPNDGG